MSKLDCIIQYINNGNAIQIGSTSIIGSNVNPLTGIQSTKYGSTEGTWTYFLYNYSYSDTISNSVNPYERISFVPNTVSSGSNSFMYILSQGGTCGSNGNNYISNGITNYGGGGGGGGGGQAYTHQLNIINNPVFVTLYPCDETTNSQYIYSLDTTTSESGYDGEGSVTSYYYTYQIKVGNGGNGGNGGNATSTANGIGGNGGTAGTNGTGGANANGSSHYYFGGGGGNAGAGGGSANSGNAGSSTTYNGSPGSSIYNGTPGSTTMNFPDGTSGNVGKGGYGGNMNTSPPIVPTAGNVSQFMFYYFTPS